MRLADVTFLNVRVATVTGTIFSGGSSVTSASSVNTDTTNFNGILSTADTTTQAALDTIDDHTHLHNATTNLQGGISGEYYHLTSGQLTNATQLASGSTSGILSSTDWTDFDSKQDALTNPITGTGTSGQLAQFTGATSVIGVNKNSISHTSFSDIGSLTHSTIDGYLDQSVKTGGSPSFVRATLTQTSGTAPLTVSSDTLVTNLNADMVDGIHASSFATTSNKISDFAASTSAELAGKISDETGSGVIVYSQSPILITPNIGNATGDISGTAAKSTNLKGGNSTTLLGSIPYQSDADTTLLLSPNVTTTKKFLTMTGDATNGAAPTWDTVTYGDTGGAALSHTHGNITNAGKIGTASSLMVTTGADGTLTALSSGTISQYLRGDSTWQTLTSSQWTTATNDIYYTTGNIGIGTSDLDGTPAIGRLVIQGSTNDGTTNILVGRDSDNVNVFSVDTNGSAIIQGMTIGEGGGSVSSNTALGYRTLYNNTTGSLNTAVGNAALYLNTTGDYNVAVGATALFSNTEGTRNIAIGQEALYSNNTGVYNTAIGFCALRTNTGSLNVALGGNALYSNTTGANNTAVGTSSLYTNSVGGNNTAIGTSALFSNETGINNTAIGYDALNTNTTGANNTAIGYNAVGSSATVTNEITLGNSSVTTLRCQVTTITAISSDSRDKIDIENLTIGLEFIRKLKPVSFVYDMRSKYAQKDEKGKSLRDENGNYILSKNPDGSKKDNDTQVGFIAQDIIEAEDEFNCAWLGLSVRDNPEYLTATPGKVLMPLLKAVQELADKLDESRKEIDLLKKVIELSTKGEG